MRYSRFHVEFSAVFKKRWYEFRNDTFNYLFYAIASVIFTIITGILSMMIFKDWNKSSLSSFSWVNVKEQGEKFAFTGPDPSLASTIESLSGLKKVIFTNEEELENSIFESSEDEKNDNSKKFAFGISATAFNLDASILTIYYNSSIENVEVHQAELSSCLIDALFQIFDFNQQFSTKKSHRINKICNKINNDKYNVDKITNDDIINRNREGNNEYSQILDQKSNSGSKFQVEYESLNNGLNSAHLWGYFGPLLMSIATNYIGTVFANAPVGDRENFRLHGMLSSGLTLWVYWFANFVFDFIIYEIIEIVCWFILYAFDTDAITQNNWMATFFLFALQPIHLIPLIYTVSLFFNTLLAANEFLQIVLLMIILIPYFIVTLVIGNEISDTAAALISIVPSYCIQNGLRIASTRAVGKPVDAKGVWTGIFVILFAIQIGCGFIFALLGVLIYYIKLNKKEKESKQENTKSQKNDNESDQENLENAVDEEVRQMEDEVQNGTCDDQAIVVKELVKEYNDTGGNKIRALKKVSLYVSKGEVFGVLGANGAGKTTLMSVISGRINSTSDDIYIFGKKIKTASDAQKCVKVCPQFDNHLFPFLTPRQHFILYGSLMYYYKDNIDIDEAKGKLENEINNLEDIMGLGKFMDRPVHELSGGNKRKLGICLAFLGDPDVVFLDEPTASLDPSARLQAQALIDAKSHGKTVLLCTHLLNEAERLCSRVCIFIGGKVAAIGTRQGLSERYGQGWRVELGLNSDDFECREKVRNYVLTKFPGSEEISTRFSSVTYSIPGENSLPEVFAAMNSGKGKEGFSYFTCSSSTLERVFMDIIIKSEA
ncbi:ABC transporter family protein [Tritrichomonas foetus]|uniref:ABC transporter family protein n=1 Tax=Tritrichomonas foetus TaxID=1144522 RepID=A0A1J4K0K2_9EUKA|nr:ABC transporter family protein [Tritrichomonas foetus]|eukprot:OHT03021.1 ABC transporter family protein [Tritrichomonas foetus]